MIKQSILVVVSLLAFLGVAWSALLFEEGREADPEKVVVTVNGVSYYEPDLFGEVNRLLPTMKLHRNISDRRFVQIVIKGLSNLVINELVYQDAKAQGLKVSSKELDKDIKSLSKELKEPLEKILERNNWTISQLRTQIEREKLIKRHYKEKREALEKEAAQLVNDEFTTDYYENNKNKFVIPGRVRLREILIKADSGGGPAHWEKVSMDAMKIISRIHSGEDFAELAKELSEDEYAVKGGDMGLAHVGSFIPEIERAIRGLGVGEIAGPVMTLYGYHILKLEERAPSVQKSYDEVKVGLKDELAKKEQKRLWIEWMDNLRESATIDYAPDMKELSAE